MINLKHKLLVLVPLLVIGNIVSSTGVANAQQVGSNFVANRIIEDSLFYNGNEMTASQIQQFLNARIPVCDTNGSKLHSSGQTRAQYGASVGNPAPYICLKDYVASSTPAKSDSGLCAAMPAQGSRSAAQIIDDVARACNISQKALIVTLQKEQSLITDDWPWPVQYEKAMGYYCPDDPTRPGWCAPEYAGFFNQVYNAARQLQRYRQFPDSFNHALGRTSYVAFQANAPSCSGTNLTMQTAATAALYNYTPYQPNAAALNNLYGTGDSCSAYGNRNFWRMFNDWFGPSAGRSIKSPIALAKNQNGILSVVGAANNGSVYVKNEASTDDKALWSAWSNISGLAKTVVAYNNQNGSIQLLAIAADNTLWLSSSSSVDANSWSPWVKTSGSLVSANMTLSQDGRIQLFGVASNGTVWQRSQTAANSSTWTGWTEMGGLLRNISSSVSADGRIQLFGVASNGTVWQRSQTAANSSTWTGWTEMGGLLRNISSSVSADGRIQLFGVASNGTVWQRSQTAANSSTWTGWTEMGGLLRNISSSVSADGRIQLFGTAINDSSWQRSQTAANSSTWTGWRNINKQLSNASIALNQDDKQQVFGITSGYQIQTSYNTNFTRWSESAGLLQNLAAETNYNGLIQQYGTTINGDIYMRVQSSVNSNSWTSWQKTNGALDDISIARNQDGRLQVFGVASNGTVWQRSQTAASSSTWTIWSEMGGLILKNIAAETNNDGSIQIYGTTINGDIYMRVQSSVNSNSWTSWQKTNGALDDISIARNQDGRLQVFGVASNGTVWQRSQTAASSSTWTIWSEMGGQFRNIVAEADSSGKINLFSTASNGTVWQSAQTTVNSTSWSPWLQLQGKIGY
jgi:hypothetical protein